MGNAATARTLSAAGTSPAASLRTGGLQDGLGNSTVAAMLGAPATERVKNPHEGGPLGWIRGGLGAVGGFLADQGWGLLRRAAPELEPILRKGVREWLGEQLTGALGWLLDMLTAPLRGVSGAAGTLNRLFKRMVDWMRAGAANLVTTACKLISDGSEQVVKVVDGIEDAEQTGLAELKEVAGEAGDFLGGLWDKLGEPVADLLGRAGSEAWARIQQFGQWLWDKTKPIRDAGSMAWNWLKDIIGIGSGTEGRNGVIQWVQARAEGVWTWVKSKLGPIPTPLKVAGGALLLLSPAGPLLAAGALAFGVIKGAKWLWHNLSDPDSLVRMRTTLVEEILPELRSSVGAVKDFINKGVAWLGDTLNTVSEGLRGLADKVTAPILAPLSDLVGWLREQNDKLVRWVDEHAKPLAALIAGALKRLHDLGGQLLDVLKQVITAAANPFGISGLILGAVWQALPACMRSAILKFLLRLVQGALRLMPATALGPLGAVLREAMIGFVNRALEEKNLAELERVADRFARLATKGSWDFTVGYGIGLLKGVWDGIAGPFILLWDIAKLLGNAVVWLGKIALTALTPAGRALVASIRASWSTINAEIRPAVSAFLKGPKDPGRIFKLIGGVMNQIASAARSAGAKVFDKLMGFLHKPDRQLGESIGFITGVIVFEVVLTVLTAGGYAAKAVIQRVSRLFTRAMTKIADLLRQLGGLYPKVKNVLNAVVRFAGTNPALRRIAGAADTLFKKFLALLRLAYGVAAPTPRTPGRTPTFSRPGGGRRGIGQQLDWLGNTNPLTGRPFHPDTVRQEVDDLRRHVLRTNDIGRVQAELSRLGLTVDRRTIERIKRYNFDSPGLELYYETYAAWRRLATGTGTVSDARYIVHEAAELRELDRIGFDYMGRRFDELSPAEKRRWLSDFDRHYMTAHSRALWAEYNFLAERVRLMTNGQVEIGPVLAAVADPRSEGRRNMLVDGVLLENHRMFAEWSRRANETVTVSRSVQVRLRLTTRNPTLRELIQSVKAARRR